MLAAVVLIALLVRGAVGIWALSNESSDLKSSDPDAYRAIAETLASTGVYGLTDAHGDGQPTAFRPPLYPYLLSWITTDGKLSDIAVAGLHTFLGVLTVVCTFLASRRLLGETRDGAISVAAAMLVAVDPILLQQSTLIMTETLATALVAVIVWWWSRQCESPSFRWAIVLGGLLSLAYLCRPTFLVWAAMLCFGVMMMGVPKSELGASWAKRLGISAAVGSVVLVAVGVWMLRNAREVGHPVWATTHGGYTLLLGNNPLFYDYLDEGAFGTTWDPQSFFLAHSHRYDGDPNTDEFWRRDWATVGTIDRRVTEHEDDRVAYDAARATIDRQPKQFLGSCLVRLGRLWTPIPHHTPGRSWLSVVAIGLYYTLFTVAMFIGLWRLATQSLTCKWWPIWMLVITLSLVHAVYWSNLRMRAPVIPGLAIIAAAACVRPKRNADSIDTDLLSGDKMELIHD